MSTHTGLSILWQSVIYFTSYTCGFQQWAAAVFFPPKIVVISLCEVAGSDAGQVRTDQTWKHISKNPTAHT
jgi:hypothetical protein